MLFISFQKLFSFSRYSNFCLDFLVLQKKRLHQKDKVNFKIYDITTWLTNNYLQYKYCPISPHKQKKTIFFKNHPENEAGRLVPDLFLHLRARQKGLQLLFFLSFSPRCFWTDCQKFFREHFDFTYHGGVTKI